MVGVCRKQEVDLRRAKCIPGAPVTYFILTSSLAPTADCCVAGSLGQSLGCSIARSLRRSITASLEGFKGAECALLSPLSLETMIQRSEDWTVAVSQIVGGCNSAYNLALKTTKNRALKSPKGSPVRR